MQNTNGKGAGIIGWTLSYPALPIAIAIVLAGIGVFGLLKMPRNEFPAVTVRQALIIGAYPGASSEEVRQRVAAPLEKFLFSFGEINFSKTQSFCQSGMLHVVVELNERTSGSSIALFWNKLRTSLPELQPKLPAGVSPLLLKSDFGETATVLLSVEASARADLSSYIDSMEDQLRSVPQLARIGRTGEVSEEVRVDIDREKLLEYGISREQLVGALKNAVEVAGVGNLPGLGMERPLRLLPKCSSFGQLKNEVIKVEGGKTVRLEEVASIYRLVRTDEPFATTGGRQSVILSLEMSHGGNIVEFGKKVAAKLEQLSATMPADIHVTTVSDQPKVVEGAVNLFLVELVITLLVVVAVTIVLLPIRVALIAAATIPMTMSATVGVMYMLGFELNIVTLGAMLIVLGIVVDDPIVVIDNYLEQLDSGQRASVAALWAARRLFPSVLIATLIIGATFMPLEFYLTGLASDFIGEFPFTILIALGFSLAISMLIVPYACSRLIVFGLRFHPLSGTRRTLLERVQGWFDNKLRWTMANRRTTILSGVGIVALGLMLMALLPLQLFPKVERDQFAIEVQLDQGCSLLQTARAVQQMEAAMQSDPRIVSFSSFIGGALPRFHATYAPAIPGSNYAQILVRTRSARATEKVISDYQRRYSQSLPNGYLRMKQLTMVSAPAPIEVRISGGEIAALKRIGEQVMEIGRGQKGVIWPRTDYQQMREAVTIDLDAQRAASYHLDRASVAGMLTAGLEGLELSEIWEGTRRLPIKVGFEGAAGRGVSDFPLVAGADQPPVRLGSIATIRPTWEQGRIVYRNGIPTLTVLMDVVPGENAIRLLDRMRDRIASIPLGQGTSLAFGGEQELQDENLLNMIEALVTSLLLIFHLLLLHFKHVKHALLAMATIPLSIPGVGLGLTLMHYPFGFTAFVGFLGVCGLVVRNAMLMIDLAEEYRMGRSMSALEAVSAAASRRMRPIFLTTAAAAAGVVTMIASGSPLWGPMGTVICFGLLFSMVLTLFVLPAIYSFIFRDPTEVDSGAMVKPLYNFAH